MRKVFVFILGIIVICGWALSLEAVEKWTNKPSSNMPALRKQWKSPQDMVEDPGPKDIEGLKNKLRERKEELSGAIKGSEEIRAQIKNRLEAKEVRVRTRDKFEKDIENIKKDIAALKEKLEAFMKEMEEKYGDEESELADEEGLKEKSEEYAEFAAKANEIKAKVKTLKAKVKASLGFLD